MAIRLCNRTEQELDSGALVQMRDIVKTFKTAVGDFEALKRVNADFAKGEFVSVVGKSGSGKSTLVNMLTGIDHPTSGEVKIGDTYVHRLNESRMARWRGRNLGIVFQFYQLLPMLSLVENVMLPMDFCKMYAPAKRKDKAMELLHLVGLTDLAHKMPAAVSRGQQQGAAIARALANDPPLIVADEPTGNLDSRAAALVFGIFEELSRQGKTIIMVTHDNTLADRASRKMLLADGEVIHEMVARTMPLLTDHQMLRVTKHLFPQRFGPGETIIRQGERHSRFHIISKGETEVHLKRREQAGVVARLGPGQYFGEVELLRMSARAVASVKAALHSAVEVLTLDGPIFAELMDEAHAMREALEQVVSSRLAQNAMWYLERGGHAQTALA